MIRRSPALTLLVTVLGLWLVGRLLIVWPWFWSSNGEQLMTERRSPMVAKAVAREVSAPLDPVQLAGDWTWLALAPGSAAATLPMPVAPGRLRRPSRRQPYPNPVPSTRLIDTVEDDNSVQSLMLALALAPYRSAKAASFSPRPGHVAGGLTAFPSLRAQPPDVVGRWSGAAWLVLRCGAGNDGLAAASGSGMLGGSQGGLRLAGSFGRSGRSEAYLRLVTTGRDMEGGEAAVGVDWQPLPSLPVRLAVERRQRVSGGNARSAFAALAVGGVSDLPLADRWRLDGYAAAGLVGARRQDLFAEGAVRAERSIARWGSVRLAGGAGLWGAAQPDAARLDVGPGLSLSFNQRVAASRLSLDWRQRLAGHAAPDNGVAMTLAADF